MLNTFWFLVPAIRCPLVNHSNHLTQLVPSQPTLPPVVRGTDQIGALLLSLGARLALGLQLLLELLDAALQLLDLLLQLADQRLLVLQLGCGRAGRGGSAGSAAGACWE